MLNFLFLIALLGGRVAKVVWYIGLFFVILNFVVIAPKWLVILVILAVWSFKSND